MKKGKLIIISGPSGVGKGSIITGIKQKFSHIPLAISATTRPPRPHEKNGQDYFFLDNAAFDSYIESNHFLEWCNVHNFRYGTLHSQVYPTINNGNHVLLEIDVQGAEKIYANIPQDVIRIFIAPPTLKSLSSRLKNRNTEPDEVIKQRLKNSNRELSFQDQYDHIIINDVLSTAIEQVCLIIDQISNPC